MKFGRYQRNIFTFYQSCIFFAIYQFLLSVSVVILLVLSIMEQPVQISFYFILIYYLILDIVKSVIIPLIIIKRSHSRLPQLFSSESSVSGSDHFYVRRPVLSPRHVIVIAASYQKNIMKISLRNQVRMAETVSRDQHLR